jgi:CelD/BcsL family acetyltransferase involved in cellulose biosynthesis
MKIEIFNSLDSAKESWLAAQESGECYVFQTFEWLENWHTRIGAALGTEPCIVSVGSDDGESFCFLPFEIETRGPFRLLAWMGGPLADYGAPLLSGSLLGEPARSVPDFAAMWREVLDRLPPFDAVWLKKMPRDIGSLPNPFLRLECHRYHSSAHHAHLGGDWESFYNSHSSAKTRSKDRRKHRRLSELGELAFHHTNGSDQRLFDEIANSMVAQKERRYREIQGSSALGEDFRKRFFTDPTKRLRDSGMLHVSALALDGRFIATHWGMTHRKRFYHFMPSFAEGTWKRYSPGRLILFHLFRACIDSGIEIFDFTIGDEEYKDVWCDTRMPLYQYFRARTGRGRLLAVFYRLYLAVISVPLLFSLAKVARRVFRRLRHGGP